MVKNHVYNFVERDCRRLYCRMYISWRASLGLLLGGLGIVARAADPNFKSIPVGRAKAFRFMVADIRSSCELIL